MKLRKQICSECPFKSNSLPGWLGPHTLDQILDSQRDEIPFSCHKERTDKSDVSDITSGRLHICRGWMASASKSVKLFGTHPFYGEHLKQLQKEIEPEDIEKVMDKQEFRVYHDRKRKT